MLMRRLLAVILPLAAVAVIAVAVAAGGGSTPGGATNGSAYGATRRITRWVMRPMASGTAA